MKQPLNSLRFFMFNKTKILNIMDRRHDSFPVFVEHLKEIEKLLHRKDIFFLKIFNLKKSKFILSLQEKFISNIDPYLNNENSIYLFENFYTKYFQNKNYLISNKNCLIDCFFLFEALKINSHIVIKDIADCNKNNYFFFGDFFSHIHCLKKHYSLDISDNQLITIFDYFRTDKEFIDNICKQFQNEHYFFNLYSLYLEKNELKHKLNNF